MNERTNERKNEQTQHPKRSLRWFIIVELASGYCWDGSPGIKAIIT